jgi:predicted TIM-barrel fold metal-dependent hydrolase
MANIAACAGRGHMVYGEFLKDVPELLRRPELSDQAKQKILYDNAREFYRI